MFTVFTIRQQFVTLFSALLHPLPDTNFTFSHEDRFLVAGLKVKKLPDWSARQAAYLTAVKEFLAKLKPEFSTLHIKFVRAIRYEPKLLLSVECEKAKQ